MAYIRNEHTRLGEHTIYMDGAVYSRHYEEREALTKYVELKLNNPRGHVIACEIAGYRLEYDATSLPPRKVRK